MDSLNIRATGFVNSISGSVASANAVILEDLISLGHDVWFFSKADFVDPRASLDDESSKKLRFVDCTNKFSNTLRERAAPYFPAFLRLLLSAIDTHFYHRLLVKEMKKDEGQGIDVWFGDWARGRGNRPVVSFVQGPPGTDARSVATRKNEIIKASSRAFYWKLYLFSLWKLRFGTPHFRYSDCIIVGSQWSKELLCTAYHVASEKIYVLPYPIDLELFRPTRRGTETKSRLRLLWVGRFVPRKRLELFVEALGLAVSQGCDVEATIIGQSGFVPGYEKFMEQLPVASRITHLPFVPRSELPAIMNGADVLVQPSDEENFGSSAAEALACGTPVIVGCTNGTSDYICERSVKLESDSSQCLSEAIIRFAKMKIAGQLSDPMPSRRIAEQHFERREIASRLIMIMQKQYKLFYKR